MNNYQIDKNISKYGDYQEDNYCDRSINDGKENEENQLINDNSDENGI